MIWQLSHPITRPTHSHTHRGENKLYLCRQLCTHIKSDNTGSLAPKSKLKICSNYHAMAFSLGYHRTCRIDMINSVALAPVSFLSAHRYSLAECRFHNTVISVCTLVIYSRASVDKILASLNAL